ncbi:MAG: class I SAM-dependent methyltransferase [Methanobacteriota archaeon]
MPEVLRVTRALPWREAAKESFGLRPMLLAQFRHEDFRGARVLDVGTGEGRLAFVAAHLGARVIGVDTDRSKLQQARSYAGVRDLRRAEFVWGDVEKSSYHEFSPDPFDFVISNLCMSPEIVFRSARALRPGGKMIFCCHHADHWKETKRGSRWSFSEAAMEDLLKENGFTIEFIGVDTIVAQFDAIHEVERYLRDATVRRWAEDGRWEALSDGFASGHRTLTSAYLVVKARRRTEAASAED